jgi:hypothetical protein
MQFKLFFKFKCLLWVKCSIYSIKSTFPLCDISVGCPVYSVSGRRGIREQRHLRYTCETPKLYQNNLALRNTADVTGDAQSDHSLSQVWVLIIFKSPFTISMKRERCYSFHRLSTRINRPSKRRKEKYLSHGHCQCQKEMDDHLPACQQFLTESHIVTRLANERASFLNMNDINDISIFGTSNCHHCCSFAQAWMLILWFFCSIPDTSLEINKQCSSLLYSVNCTFALL